MSYNPSSQPRQIPQSASRSPNPPYGSSLGRYSTSPTAYPPTPTYGSAPTRSAPTSLSAFEGPSSYRRQSLPHGQHPSTYHPPVSYVARPEHDRRGSASSSHSRSSTHSKNSHHSHSSKRRLRSEREKAWARAERDLNDRATLGDTLFMIWNSIRDMMPVGKR